MSRSNSKMSDRRNKPNDRHEPGQVDNRNFTPMVKSLYLKEETADLFFVFTTTDDQTERVPAHKLLLSTSEKFAKLFADAEAGQNEFKMNGIPVEAFKEFLQFFYMPKFKLTFENIDAIMSLAQDYGREEMLVECSVFLAHKLTTENMIWGYGLAIRFDRAILKKNCELKIADNAEEVLKSNCFLECERDVLRQILQLDSLKCIESQVLTSCLLWAKTAANRKGLDGNSTKVLREELGDLLYEVRFKSIAIQNFAMIVGSFKGFFSVADLEEITQLIGLKDYKSETFNSKTRLTSNGNNNVNGNENNGANSVAGGGTGSGHTNEEKHKDGIMYANRYTGNFATRYYIQKAEKTRFEAQKSLRLVGIVCGQVFNAKQNDNKVNIDAKVTVSEQVGIGQKPVEIFESTLTLSSEKETHISICCPIPIEPNRKYEILLQLDSAQELYNQAELKGFVELKNGVKIRFLGDDTRSFDTSKCGLVQKLLFKRA
ncbi:uncharacterized protein LOC129570566 [Sitodiplosis mosellana]|uniref:uncharacterized protein LOC129570566 n=1 Tax=Sitodiplosis mosellana TaxID=263140 RepID=UPI002443A2B0|nr:uncharacterized protein LOC129570566 [Sitodiplosis mosellana]